MSKSKLLSPQVIYLLGINSIIGSGIFLLAGKIYQQAGNWSLLAILLAGLSLLVIAFSYANMSQLYPENGGAFIYAKNVFGRFPGFIVGMVTWLLGTVTLATEVSALLTALKMVLPELNPIPVGLALLLALGILSYFGSTLIARLDTVTAFLKLGLVFLFILTAISLIVVTHTINFTTTPAMPTTLGGFLTAYGTVFFFFTGFSFLPVNAEKMSNPSKNLPKLLTLVMLSCITLYLVIQGLTIAVLGNHLPNTIVPAATIFARLVGPLGAPFFVVGIGFAILGVIVATTFNTPTILASLALAHEDVPLVVAKINRFNTPTWAILLTTLSAMGLFLSGNYLFLSSLTVFMSFVQYLTTGLANFKKNYRWTGLGTIMFSLILLTSFTANVLLLGGSCLLILGLVYFIVKVDDDHLAQVKHQKAVLQAHRSHI